MADKNTSIMQDMAEFAAVEDELRQLLGYPPRRRRSFPDQGHTLSNGDTKLSTGEVIDAPAEYDENRWERGGF